MNVVDEREGRSEGEGAVEVEEEVDWIGGRHAGFWDGSHVDRA